MWYSGDMKRVLFAFLGVVMGVLMMGGAVSAARFEAGDECTSYFLGMRPWYMGLERDGCNVKSVSCPPGDGCPEMSTFVWGIVTNVLYNLFVIVGYLAIGLLMFGGYTYLLARGDPGRIEKGKKIIISAIAGLIIAVLASFIVSFIGSNVLRGL